MDSILTFLHVYATTCRRTDGLWDARRPTLASTWPGNILFEVANIQSAVFTIDRFQKVLGDFQNRIMLHYFIPHVDNAIIINGDVVCLAVTVLQHIEEVTNRPTRSPPRQICII
jgi:hypothetical protein